MEIIWVIGVVIVIGMILNTVFNGETAKYLRNKNSTSQSSGSSDIKKEFREEVKRFSTFLPEMGREMKMEANNDPIAYDLYVSTGDNLIALGNDYKNYLNGMSAPNLSLHSRRFYDYCDLIIGQSSNGLIIQQFSALKSEVTAIEQLIRSN